MSRVLLNFLRTLCRIRGTRVDPLIKKEAGLRTTFSDLFHSPESPADGQPSLSMLSRLLEHFFSSPNQEHGTRIIRRRNLLNLERPRPTSPTLLFAILCKSTKRNTHSLCTAMAKSFHTGLASYMPRHDGGAVLPMISHGEFISMRRLFLSQTLELIKPVMLGETEPTFDDAIVSVMLGSIGASNDENHLRLRHWTNFSKFIVRKLKLNIEPKGFDEEEKEERRRFLALLFSLIDSN
jgi:hypothetical protein